MSKKISFQFDGTDKVWTSEEYNLELNINTTRSELGLPYWTDYKIIPADDRTNPSNNNDSKIDNPNLSSSNSQEPTPVRKRTRTRKVKS
jgi:hypothetical protein